MKTLLALLLCTLALPCRAQEKETIALNLQKGKTYSCSVRTSSHVALRFGNEEVTLITPVSFDADFFVQDVNGLWFELKSTFRNVSVKALAAGEKPAPDPKSVTRLLDSLARKPVEILLGRQGQITDIVSFRQLLAHFINLYPKDEIALVQLMGTLQDCVLSSIGSFASVSPGHPVAEGESWTFETPHNIGSMMTIPVTASHLSTLLKSNGEHWEISDSCTLTSSDRDTYVQIVDGQAKGGANGTTTNKMTLDKKSGWVLSLVMKQEIAGLFHMKSDDGTEEYDVKSDVKRSMSITGKVPK